MAKLLLSRSHIVTKPECCPSSQGAAHHGAVDARRHGRRRRRRAQRHQHGQRPRGRPLERDRAQRRHARRRSRPRARAAMNTAELRPRRNHTRLGMAGGHWVVYSLLELGITKSSRQGASLCSPTQMRPCRGSRRRRGQRLARHTCRRRWETLFVNLVF